MNTIDFLLYLAAALCFFFGLIWRPVPPRPDFFLLLGLLFFVLPWVISSAQHLS